MFMDDQEIFTKIYELHEMNKPILVEIDGYPKDFETVDVYEDVTGKIKLVIKDKHFSD